MVCNKCVVYAQLYCNFVYAAAVAIQFSSTYGFNPITSSPHYHQSNGLAEHTVKTVKRMLITSPDVNLALLSYRATPLPWCGLSPAELLMGRVIRTDVPQDVKTFTPEWSYLPTYRDKEKRYREVQKQNYDHPHRTRRLPELPNNTIPGTLFHLHQSQGHIMLKYRLVKLGETVHINFEDQSNSI